MKERYKIHSSRPGESVTSIHPVKVRRCCVSDDERTDKTGKEHASERYVAYHVRKSRRYAVRGDGKRSVMYELMPIATALSNDYKRSLRRCGLCP